MDKTHIKRLFVISIITQMFEFVYSDGKVNCYHKKHRSRINENDVFLWIIWIAGQVLRLLRVRG